MQLNKSNLLFHSSTIFNGSTFPCFEFSRPLNLPLTSHFTGFVKTLICRKITNISTNFMMKYCANLKLVRKVRLIRLTIITKLC